MEKETKAALHSKDKAYAKEIIGKLKEAGIEATLDNFLGNYIIYVSNEDYDAALSFARLNADENRLGSLNHYDEFRGLLAHSLAYAEMRDHKDIDKAWEYDRRRPYYINNLIKDVESIVPGNVYISVNGSDASIEILTSDKDQTNHDELSTAIVELIESKYSKFFKRCSVCKANGEVIRVIEKKEKLPFQDLFYSTMFLDGMFYPIGSNIAPKDDCDNNLDETGYWMSTHSFGGQDFTLSSTEEGKLKGSIELYEKMQFNSKWDAEKQTSISVRRIESILVDNVRFDTSIEVLSDDECVVTTNFELKRKADVFPKLPFNQKYPTKKSVRNGLFAYPLENGEYSGTYTERFVKIANGTRLLHFSDQSPFFEVFEISDDFSFANVKTEKYPKVFDDTTFDKNDKDMNEIMRYLGKDAKKLVLSHNE